ncbi:MAG: FGGY family carbohydrate kinase, partial [Pseudomonadota bacterium]
MAYMLTADGGTESLRARVYDLDGTCLASHAEPYDTAFSAGARAEQNPADWWTNFMTASRAAIAQSGVDPAAIDAIAYATTSCTVVA